MTSSEDDELSGEALYALVRDLYPICRSITGQGVRDTLALLERHIPLARAAVPSGTAVFDWVIPDEWNIRDAYIRNARGERIVDLRRSNLHVVSYSVPVHARMTLAELRPHLHSLPDRPDWIPYRTSYYAPAWGFCLSHRQLQGLAEDEEYEVCIDSTLAPGELTYGELVIPGAASDEVLIWTHICHPSLCNDNLSGIVVAVFLARRLLARSERRFTFRFVFAPATIGAIAWLHANESTVHRIRHGLVLASLGDAGPFTYKRSRSGSAEVDQAAEYVIGRGHGGTVEPFSPYGYDERQFGSPGFNLPVGRLTRTPNGRYPEYHTSADNLDFVTARSLGESLGACEELLGVLEENRRYVNLAPKCEPRLGKRGLFHRTGGPNPSQYEEALLWVLSLSDGQAKLLDVAMRSGIDFRTIAGAARALAEAGLLVESA